MNRRNGPKTRASAGPKAVLVSAAWLRCHTSQARVCRPSGRFKGAATEGGPPGWQDGGGTGGAHQGTKPLR
eukprot:2032609-Pyramimonas_sp.AAC.1